MKDRGIVIKNAMTIFFGVALIVPAMYLAGISSDTHAAVKVDDAGKVKLFGDVRIRSERDSRTTQADVDQDRTRTRFRARFGVGFAPNDSWSGKIRMATSSSSLNTQHQTFGLDNPGDNANFGIDQAFIAYNGVEKLTVIGGKAPLNHWQQTEVFFDEDIYPEGLEVIYKPGPVTLNGSWMWLTDGGWDTGPDDVSFVTGQAVYGGDFGKNMLKVALGGAKIYDDDDVFNYNSEKHWQLSAQLKRGGLLLGGEYMQGDADEEEIAWVVQARYKINKTWGLRAYWYHVEANSTLGDGRYTQDNFPEATGSADNFEGPRLQVDFKVAENTAIDLRYYDTEILKEGLGDGVDKERDRIQLNINIKF